MLLWKEIRETVPLFAFAFAAMVAVTFLRWEGWRPEFFEFQFWIVVGGCFPFILVFSGAGAIAGEREGKTLDFLYSRPVALAKIVIVKYLIRLACLIIVLFALVLVFNLLRSTHNIKLEELTKGSVILFSFLLYTLSVSFSFSCLSDTSAKAFVSSIVLLSASMFLINATPFFRYAWFWSNSIDDLWLGYLWFYGGLSCLILALSGALINKNMLLDYQWKHLGVAAVVCFLLFVRSVSTTFWLIPYIAANRDMELIGLAREPVEKILLHLAQKKSDADIVYRYLVSLNNSRIDREVLRTLSHPDPQVRNMAIRLLTDRKTKDANIAIAGLLDDPDDSVRHSALSYLEMHPYEDAAPKLVELLGDKNSSIRYRAVDALAAVKRKDCVKYLMPLLKDPNPRVCGRAIVYLCAFDYGEAQPEIVELLLHHHVTSVRETAAVTLRNMKSEPACEALIQALSHKDQRIVYSAANSLAVLHCTDAIQPLVQFSKQDPLRFIPGLAAMGAIGGPEAKAALKELFSRGDTPAPIKVATAFELAKMGDEEAHQFLREQADHFVKKEPTLLTEESAHTLAEMKDYSAVPMLINLMKESRWQGGYSYGEILTELTGKYYGWDVQRWQEWWDKNKDEFLSPTSKT